jgi:hypothetical protein
MEQLGKSACVTTKRRGGAHMTYKNSADRITIEQALRLYEELGVCVIIDEGQHVTFIVENYPMDRGN